MQQYQFERIYSLMEKEFGKMKKGQEEAHAMMLFPMECNLLKVHRQFPASNSRRLKEAIALTLFDVKARYTGETFELGQFRNEDNERLEHALRMTFDPFENEDIRSFIDDNSDIDLAKTENIRALYTEPVVCMLRIKESVDTWEKRMGINGYFSFLEQVMGSQIAGTKMEFAVAVDGDTLAGGFNI